MAHSSGCRNWASCARARPACRHRVEVPGPRRPPCVFAYGGPKTVGKHYPSQGCAGRTCTVSRYAAKLSS